MKLELEHESTPTVRGAFGLRRLQRRFSCARESAMRLHVTGQSGAEATAVQTLREDFPGARTALSASSNPPASNPRTRLSALLWLRLRRAAVLFPLILVVSCSRQAESKTKSAETTTTSRAVATMSPGQLVTNLLLIDLKHGPVTPEQAATWKQTLKQLTERGQAALPAIREFLGQNLDLNFDPAGNTQLIGWSSLRLALLDALHNIGGPEATATLAQTLQTTADPAELATVLKFLEQSEPGKHRAAAVNAAREVLNLAASGQWDGRDVGPLFEILKNYGGEHEAADLEKYANTWFAYTPLTLAELPDGAGIASLIRLARNTNGSVTLGHDIYQRMLAQAAAQYPAAADALIEQTRADRIAVGAWPGVAVALTGATLHLTKPLLEPPVAQPGTRSYHVSVGNQNYLEAPPPADLTANQLGDRIRLIDKLLEATSNPAAIDVLEGARITLAARLAAAKR